MILRTSSSIYLNRFKKLFVSCEVLIITLNAILTKFILNLVNDKLDAQLFYFIIRLLQSSTCCEQRRAHHQEVKFY